MKLFFTICAGMFILSSFAQEIELVKNINTEVSFLSHDPDPGVVWNDMYFYGGWSVSTGVEPWVTDGTLEGTQLLKDVHIANAIQLGMASSQPSGFSATSFGVFFEASNNFYGDELYFSNGTPEGTYLIRDFISGQEDSNVSQVFDLNGLGFFTVKSDETESDAIWTTDGTPEGTQLFYDMEPSVGIRLVNAYAFNGMLFMNMISSNTGQELYVTDGTVEGTILVKDIEPGIYSSSPQNWFEYNGGLYFTCWNENDGLELWTTDGTTDGTHIIKDINPSNGSSNPGDFVEHNGLLYFTAQNEAGSNLWVSDGTETGTLQVSNIDISQPHVSHVVVFNDEIHFVANSENNGFEVWKSDGTTEGTQVAYSTHPEDDDFADNLFVFNGDLFFSGQGPDNGREMWKVDQETLVAEEWDLHSGEDDSFPYYFFEHNGKMYFAADEDNNGYELFTSDGTLEGTFRLLDVNPEESGWSQNITASVGEYLVYIGVVSDDNRQMYSTDGTIENTGPLTSFKDNNWSRIREATSFDGYLFFNADDGENGQELWRSDGTTEGTFMYQEMVPGVIGGTFFNMRTINDKLLFDSYIDTERKLMVLENSSGTAVPVFDAYEGDDNVENLTVWNEEVYFSARDTDDFGTGTDLWKTDGTSEGTVKVHDFGTYDISPEKFFATSSHLWFFGEQYGSSAEWGLYRTDGTSEGTEFVQYHALEGNNWGSYLLEEYNGGVLYTVFTLAAGRELYFSDGTAEGSYLVANIAPGSDSPFIVNFVEMNGLMYFLAKNSVNGVELWRTDATALGTEIAVELQSGPSSGALSMQDGTTNLIEINGLMMFSGANEFGDYELFLTDGTPEGTEMLVEINPNGSADPHNFFKVDDYIYFAANDGVHGFELWKTDGTAEGTEMVGDVMQGLLNGYPRDFVVHEDYLYFQAYQENAHLELYRVDTRCMAAEIATESLEYCVGDEVEISANVIFSNDNVELFEWSFSDNTTLSGANVTKTVEESGPLEIEVYLSTIDGCEATANLTIQVADVPQISFFGPDEPLCLTTDYVPANMTTGTNEDTEWLWDFGDDNQSTSQFPQHTFSEPGLYDISLTASNGECSSTLTQSQEVYIPLTEIESITPSTCNGSDDGAIVVSGTSILGEVSYSIDGTNFQQGGEFLGLEAGELVVSIMDDYGCLVSEIVEIPEPDPLEITIEITDDDGSGNGAIEANGQGGTSPYTYSIDGGNNSNSIGIFESLAGGTYTVWMSDGNGCIYEENVEIDFADFINELRSLDVLAYPNPADDILTLQTESLVGNRFTLLDSTGHLVFEGVLQNTTDIDVSSLAAGLYTVRVFDVGNMKIMVK